MTSIHAVTTGFVRESARGGVPEMIGALKYFAMSGFELQLHVWQASALSFALCPSGLVGLNLKKHPFKELFTILGLP